MPLVRIDSGVVVAPWREKGRDVWYPGVLRRESVLSPNSTTTVAAYIITGIHIYAWNTQDRRGGGGKRQNEEEEEEEEEKEEEEEEKVLDETDEETKKKGTESEECAREDASRWLG